MKYRIEDQVFDTIEDAGRAWKPGTRIIRADGSSLNSDELTQAMAAWMRGKKAS